MGETKAAALPPPAARSLRPRRVRPVLFACAFALLLIHAGLHWPFLADDALISLRYAERLLAGQGLTWMDGPPVEGYSNLLWILLTAGLGSLGLDLVAAARLLGMACTAGTLAVLAWRAGARSGAVASWIAPAAGLMLFAGSAPAAVWAIGGLEAPLAALLLALALPPLFRLAEVERPRAAAALGPATALALGCLTRPDGPLLAAGAACGLILARRLSGRGGGWVVVFALAGLPALATLGQLAFRLAYYHAWVPNTALVKIHPSAHHLAQGLSHAAHGLLAWSPLSLMAMAWLAAAARRRRPRAVLLTVLLLLWTGYVSAVGGDSFPAFRLLLPALVLLAFALAEAAGDVADRQAPGPARFRLLAGATAAVTLFLALQWVDSGSRHAREERWEWQGRELALALREAFGAGHDGARPLLAVTAAGCLPYWSGLPALDLLGLNDAHLPRHPPPEAGQGRLGHELGDPDYVMARRPDLLILHVGEREAGTPPLRRLLARLDFRAAYVAVPLRLERPSPFTAWVWVRRDSPTAGVRREAGAVVVPGHLAGADSGAPVRRGPTGWAAEVTADRPGRLRLDLPPGAWDAEARGRPAGVLGAELRDRGEGMELEVRATEGVALVDQVVLRRRGTQ